MGRRRYKKVTTVGRDIFGNKRIETRWVPEASGCGVLVVLAVIVILIMRSCR